MKCYKCGSNTVKDLICDDCGQDLKKHPIVFVYKLNEREIHNDYAPKGIEQGEGTEIRLKQYIDFLEGLKRDAADSFDEKRRSGALLYYRLGKGFDSTDHSRAYKYYERAAHLGLPDAMLEIGLEYEKNGEADIDNLVAMVWYTKAAILDSLEAQWILCTKFERSLNFERAAFWCRKAAEQGYAKAQSKLGEMYEEGKGVEQNYIEALNWYRKAEKQGLVIPNISRLEKKVEDTK